ncbi:MAG: right-handed parallel beta-helix repeat-containing protein [Nitrospirae bacterium]|nr:right-handed parallel beta-helix repeat-containing protein [Nitrospirota bacterium]
MAIKIQIINKRLLSGLISFILIIGFITISHAATVTWTGNGFDSLASTSANWNTIPQNGDDVIFDNSSKDCVLDISLTLSSLITNSGYSGIITVDADLAVTGDVSISGGTLILNNGNLVTGAAPPSLPPAVTSEPASNINGNAAALNATVNPNGFETTVYFEWGMDTNYGNSTAPQSTGSGTGNIAVSANINRLSRNTVYHYRAVAVNAQGTSYGDDVVFTTLGGTTVGTTTISSNSTWTYAGSPYIITGNISVYGSSEPTLTIEPGVEVRFNGLYYLNIGYSSYKGRLVAQGTLSSPIIFSSNNAAPAPGNWYGIRFYNHATTESIIDYVTIEYAGYAYGGIYISNNSPTIFNSTITKNSNKGIDITGSSSPAIANSTISNNATYGIYSASSAPSISTTSFMNNGSYAISILPQYAGNLGTGNTASGNGTNGIELRAATISSDSVWPYQTIPYIVTGNISVYGASEPTLTIEPGVEVKLNGLYYLNIGYSSYKGRLAAAGTSSDPIVFTSNKATQSPGDWYGIRFYNHAANESSLDYVTIEYGGYQYGGIYISNSSPTISYSTIRYNSNSGINITGSSSPVITGCIISGNNSYGIYDNSSSGSFISNSLFTSNGSYAISINPQFAHNFGAGNTASGNGADGIELKGGTISSDTSWRYQVIPYIVTGNISVYGTSSETALTIEPGVEIRFNGLYYLNIGYSSYKGRLVAQGTSSMPIVFTSNKATPAAGDWYGIRFYNHAVSESMLDYATVEYAGYTYGGIYISNSSPTISHSIIRNNSNKGIDITGISSPVIGHSAVSNNAVHGINASGTGSVDVTFSSISGNSQYAVYSTASVLNVHHCNISGNGNGVYGASGKISDARFNWWGSPAVPGAFVNQYVNYEPWLGAPYTYPFYNMDLSATLQQFNSPGNSVDYTFSISDNSTWDFYMKNSGGTTIKTFTGSGNSGTVTWDGKDESGVIVPDGTYTYQLFSTSLNDSSQSAPLIGDIIVNNIMPWADIIIPSNNQMIGNSPFNIRGTATADYFKNYTVEYGSGAEPSVWTLIGSYTTPVNNGTLAVWDPSGLTGGNYTIKLSVNDNYTNTVTTLVRVNFLNINSLNISPPSFSPNGDGINDMTTITALITYPSNWTMDIKNSGGNTIKSFNGSGSSLSFTWDGNNSTGVIQPEGVYSFTITAIESISGATAVITGSVAIDFPEPPGVTTNPATNLNIDSATLNAVVNPNGAETTVYFQWGTDISYGNNTSAQSIGSGTGNVNVTANLTGLSWGTTYHYRVAAANISGTTYGNDMSFITAPQSPSDLTATVISSSQVNLSWTDNSYNESGFKIERKTGSNGIYNQIAAVGANVATYSDTALTPETTYFYRVMAYNSIGDSAYSNEANATPTVLPIVTTTPATYITANTARLNGVINPHGSDTTFYFQWGTTASYGNTTEVYSIGNGTGYVDAGDFLGGLEPGVIYHYRLAASNADGTAYGNEMTFTTIPGTDVSGYITTNTTWTLAGSPYVLTDNVFVYGASNPTLIIEPGVEVRFMGYYTGLYIGNSWYLTGVLKAQGTPSNPIVFTSNNPTPAPGDWMLIQFEDKSVSASILEHVIIEYGGWWDTDGWTSLFVSDDAGGNLRIRNSIIRYSKGSGIQLSGASSLTLTDSSVVNHEGNGVERFGWGNVDITGSAISDNKGTGVYANSGGSINIANSAISNNGAYGIFSEYTVNTSVYFSTLENNAWNAVVSGSSSLEIRHCNISSNGDGISSYPDKIADAGYNWWGDASGPSGEGPGIGQSIGSGINYEPWLGAPFTYPFYNMDLTATVQEFSPLNNSAGYTFSVSENADWLFSVKDPSGNTVKSFSGSGTSGSVAWDGTDSGGAQVPDGTYTYQLDSTRLSDSSQAAPFIGDVIAGTGLPKAEITYPEDGQFISGSSLLDIQGTAVDSEDFNNYKLEYNAGTAPGTWILLSSYTTPVSAGILGTWDLSNLTDAYYTVRLSVSDLAGNTATDTVEIKLFNIYDVMVSDPSFSPNGDGYKDGTSISAYLTYPADWRVDIRDSGGNTIRSFPSEGWDYSEYYFSVGWDGRDASGNIQPGGVYSYTITATEPVSGTTAAVTGSITINLSLPTAVTDPATNVAASSATLKATVNPNESPTTAYFQWGTDISYGNNTSQQSAGSGISDVSISTDLTGLSTGVIYHYRAVAVSANGTSYGEDRVFRPNNTTLTGVVTDASTGLAVPYVNVIVTDLFGTYSAVTNQSGAYSLTQVTEGDFTATFEAVGHIRQTVNGTLLYNQNMVLNIQLTPVSPLTIDITFPADGANVSSSPVTVTGSVYNSGGIGGDSESLAQYFKPATSGLLNKVSLLLKKVGNPNENIYIRISGEFLNYPYEPIAVSSPVTAGTISSSWTWVSFTFTNPPPVTAGKTYFIELYRTQRNTSAYFSWHGAGGIEGYLNGFPVYADYYIEGTTFFRDYGAWGYSISDRTFKTYINNTLDISQNVTTTGYEESLYGVDPYPVNVTVNGIQASVSNNTFSTSLPLTESPNTITAIASDQYNHTASDTVNVSFSYLPAISNIAVTNITSGSATITWTTDQQADSLVEYGTTTSYGSSSSGASMTTSHSITLTNLTSGTLYHFKVTSTNTYGISSSSGDNTFTTSPPPFTVTTVGDYGNVTVMEITGNYDAKNPDGSINTIPRQEVAKEFLRLHPDQYDFMVIFSNFDFAMPEAEARAFYTDVKNNTQGIGKLLFNNSDLYGSSKLQGTIDMGNISNVISNPIATGFDDTIATLAHEQMHRWGASIKFRDAYGNDSTALQGKDGTHWSFLLDSEASVLYGNDWTDNGDGTFTSTGGGKYYSPLDLYLAGFYDSTQVPQMLLIENPLIDPIRLPEVGATITGTPRYITINDIITAEGERIPNASTSQKNFKTAFILLTRPGTFNSNVLPGIETIRSAWAGRFTELTHGKGTIMDVTPSISIAVGSPSDSATISGSYVDVKGAVINNTGNETGVTVNGIPATVYGTQFIAENVPLTEGSNTITVTATDTAGNTATSSITVNALTTGDYIKLSSNINSGILPLDVTLKIDGSFSITNSNLNITGPVQSEILSSSADEYRVKFIAEGVYYITASATDSLGYVYQDTIVIMVFNKTQLDTLLKAKWEGMKGALMTGDITTAIGYFVEGSKSRYNAILVQMSSADINSIFSNINELKIYSVKERAAQCGAIRVESGGTFSYPVTFVIDESGIWKIMGF